MPVAGHPAPLLADTVYVVVAVGVAVTMAPVEVLNDAEGLHVYVVPPFAVSVVFCPVQMF